MIFLFHYQGKFSDEDLWIVGRTKDEALERAIEKYKLPASDIKLEQGNYDHIRSFAPHKVEIAGFFIT